MPILATLLGQLKSNDPALVELDLSGQCLDDNDISQLIEGLANNTMLTTLNLSANLIGPVGANMLANNTTLSILNLHNNRIGDKGAKALAKNTTLTTLSIGGNQIGDDGAKVLATNTTLTILNLNDSQIGAEGAKALAGNRTLNILFVASNQIGVEEAKVLAKNTTLSGLELSNNQIGDEGAKALAKNTTLTTLSIGGNQIGDEGAKALARNSTLNVLNLEYNKISFLGAIAFKHNRVLNTLMIYNNLIYDLRNDGESIYEELEQVTQKNQQQMIKRRNQSIQVIIAFARDHANKNSTSLWSKLPQEIKLNIISLMYTKADNGIGKTARQIQLCSQFIFEHIKKLSTSLKDGYRFQIKERVTQPLSSPQRFNFHFFKEVKSTHQDDETNQLVEVIQNMVTAQPLRHERKS